MKGRISLRDNEPKIIASDMQHIHDVYDSIKAINVDLSSCKESVFDGLKTRLRSSPGKVPVYLKLNTKSKKSVEIVVGEDLFVSPNEGLMNEIKDLVGGDRFTVTL